MLNRKIHYPKTALWVCAFLLSSVPFANAEVKAVFYMTQTPDSIRSFLEHADQVGILVSTAYEVDENGVVWGSLDSRVLKMAWARHVPVMPIIVNPGFNPTTIHKRLASGEAQYRMAASLVSECEHYYGIQVDFEHVVVSDRDALTHLVREMAAQLTRGGFKLSIATVHRYSDYPGSGNYAHLLYVEWRAAYDLKELAKDCDFISVIAYDQHTEHTTAGPVAGFPWVQQVLQYYSRKLPRKRSRLAFRCMVSAGIQACRTERVPCRSLV